jgi:hypothetical protein
VLIKVAEQAGGYLAEWASFSHKNGYNSVITDDDLDTMTLEMPIRAVMVAKSTTNMTEYDEIKDMVDYWLNCAYQIDLGAIFRAVRDLGFKMADWEETAKGVVNDGDYRVHLDWEKGDGKGQEVFEAWARAHWVWVGKWRIYLEDEGASSRSIYEELWVVKEDGAAKVEIVEEEDVPF